MKTVFELGYRALIITVVVVIATALVYFINSGQDAQGLSDWLVMVSFGTLAVGTVVGISNIGVKARDAQTIADQPALLTDVQEFFRAGPFGIAFAIAGALVFLVAVLVDVLF